MKRKKMFLLVLILLFCCFVFSCITTDSLEKLYIDINNVSSKKIIESFVNGNKEYKIKGDKIYCNNLISKVKLQKFLSFNDSNYFFSAVSLNYKSDGSLYLPEGIYRTVEENPQENLINVEWDDEYITGENFLHKYVISSSNFVVDEEVYSTLELDKVLSYFEDQSQYNSKFERNEFLLWYVNHSNKIFNDLSTNLVTIVTFLLDNGYFVYTDDESGALVISLH